MIEYLREEVRILRELHGKRPRFTDSQRRRLAEKAKKISYGRLKEIANVVTPDTLLRWYRKLIAAKYDSSRVRRYGRPSTADVIVNLVVRMAKENKTWGYTRIRDALFNLHHEISRDTVRNILLDYGIEPAPERGPNTTWEEFLKRHWEAMAATDFFTVEVFTLGGIVRYQVFFVMRLATREVQIAGIAPDISGPWMEQVARNLTDGLDGFLRECKFLIHDRDPLFTKAFTDTIAAAGVESVRLPRRSPNLNAFAERFVRSIKHECLDRMVFFSERMLQHIIDEYISHYHCERNHQGIESRIILPGAEAPEDGPIIRRERLGGLLNFYTRQAA